MFNRYRFQTAILFLTLACSFKASLLAQGTFGTTLIDRSIDDGAGSQVYIYAEAGGLSGIAQSFSFYNNEVFDGRVTPLIFERVGNGHYILRGVGATITPTSNGSQAYAFNLVAGTNVMQPNYTFGFTDRVVSYPGSGNAITTTDSRTGTVDWDYASPTQWYFTPSLTFDISLGQTFLVGDLLFSGETRSYSAQFSVAAANQAPTNITLTPGSLAENSASGSSVGTLTATDANVGQSHTFSLVAGGADNASFSISGTSLLLNLVPNFEVKSSYGVRVRADDGNGGTFDKDFVVSITNVNEAPTDVSLSASSLAENNATNATVGTLSSTDPDAANSHSYSLVSGAGSTDNAAFNISGSSLRLSDSANFEAKSSYSLRLRSTDQGGLFFEKQFTVTITNVNDLPVAVADAFATPTNIARTINAADLTSNDTDQDAHPITLTSVQSPTNGASVSLNAGVITYTPAAAFTGTATFTYSISDGAGGTATGTVTMTVNGSAPVVLNDTTMTITVPTTITNPVTLSGDGGITTNQPVTLEGPVTVTGTPVITTTTTVTISGPIDGTGELEKTGSGTLNLTSPSTFSGGFKATDGVVGIAHDQALGTGTVTLGGADINAIGETRVLDNPVSITGDTVVTGAGIGLAGPVTLSGPRGLQTDGNLDIDGTIQSAAGNTAITKLGTGDLVLGGNNTFNGGIEVKQGTLALAGDNAAGTGPVSLSGGKLEAIGDLEISNPVQLKSDSVVTGDSIKMNGPVEVSGSKTLTTEADVVMGGTISTSTPDVVTTLTKEGTGSLVLAPEAKNNLDIAINDGAFENKGVSYGAVSITSSAPEVVSNEGMFASQALVEGFPAVSYFDSANGTLKYMRASSADGSSYQAAVTVDSAGGVGVDTSLFVVNGRPAIAYWEKNRSRLKYVRANDAWGTSWGSPVIAFASKGQFTSLLVVDGNPAVAFKSTTNNNLCYVRALDANGTSWGAAVTVASTGDVGSYASMAMVSGRPAIACQDRTNGVLNYYRAANSTGSSWEAAILVHQSGYAGGHASMKVVGGRPAIAYTVISKTTGSLKVIPGLYYSRAMNTTGTTWPSVPEIVDDKIAAQSYLSLNVVGGFPAVSYLKSKSELNYAWASNASGTTWPNSRRILIQKISAPHSYTSLQPLSGGYAGVAFYDGKTDDIEFKSFVPQPLPTTFTSKQRISSRNDRKTTAKKTKLSKKAGKKAKKKPVFKGKNSKGKKNKSKAKGGNAPPTKPGKTKKPSKVGGFLAGNIPNKKAIGIRGPVKGKNGRSPGMSEEAEDLIWEDGATIIWDLNDANGIPGLNWDYYKVAQDLEIIATADDPIYLEIESLLPDNTPGNVTNFSPYVAKAWKIASAGSIIGFDPDKFVVTAEGFSNNLQGGSFSIAQSGNDLNLVFTPASTLVPDITVLRSGLAMTTGAAVDVGTLASSAQTTLSFTIRNDGSGPLSGLSIQNRSVLLGQALLSLNVPDVTDLAPGETLTFDAVLLNEGLAADELAVALSITSDDPDEGTFDVVLYANAAVVPVPEIAVAQTIGNVNLVSGSLTAVDFGNVSTADSAMLDFTLANVGGASLTNVDFIVDGPNSIDFHVIEEDITDLDGNTTTTFKVEFEPSAAGVRVATLYIRSNDADENPFLINLTGVGDAVPEITIESGGQELVSGAPTPADFGSQAVNAYRDMVFNVSNIGTLDLTGLSVSISGPGASHYSVQTGFAVTTLLPTEGASLIIRYSPTSSGTHNAVLRVTSNDADESNFDIALTGTANIAPEFELRDDTPAVFADGGFFDFGTALTSSTTSRSFTIRNMGSASLTGLSMSVSGAAAGDFILGGLSTPAPLDGPAGETTFSITFYPTEYGSRNAVLHIVSNDSDEGDFTLYLTGIGELPPAAPTDIVLAPSALPENTGPGSLVGSLSALGLAPEETPTFSFVSGAGDTDNSLFNLDGADLTLIGNPDYETQASYSLRVQADNGVGGSFTKVLTVTVTDVNEAPTDITLSLSSIAENNAPNATVGTLTATGDPDAGASNSFTLVSGDGDTDNGSFTIDGSVLKITPSADFETKNSYALRVEASEGLGGTFAKALTVTITNVSDAPSGTDKTINVLVNGSYTFAVSDWGFSDSDSPANAFTAVKIATLPGSGTLRLNGSNITANQTVTFSNTPAGTTWTAAAGLSSLDGLSSALSNDGSRAIVGIWAGPVYVSSNGGSSWSPVLSGITATRFAVSSDGLKIIAVTRQNNIYTSTDGGATWTSRAFSAFWASVACSADGVYAIAGTDGGNLYRSTDSGVTWTAINSLGSAYWGGAGCSADGSKMVATSTHGIHTSTDYGATWTQRFTTSGGIFTGAASSADGTRLYATYSGGFIQVSTDSGATWTARATSQDWGSVSCTADGLTAITSYGASAMVSENGGTTWTLRHTATSIRGTSVSGNGTKMLAPVGGGVRSVPLFISNGNATVITYTPSTVGSTSFTFQVQDDGADTNLDLTPNTISINATNEAPTNITLSASSIAENNAANATVGNLTATDADPGQTHSFSLVSGSGDTDNGSFTINGSALRLTPSADFETKSSYALRVQASDGFGGTFAKDFTVTITDVNEAATDITLSNTLMVENDSNLNVGTLAAVDQDASQTHTFTLVGGTGSTDNALFNISGTTLRLNSPANYEYKPTLSVRVRATDNGTGALFYEEPFTISVTDLQEPPYDITFSGSAPAGTLYANGLTARVVYATGNITGLAYSDNMLINGVNVASQLTTPISYVDFADYNTAGRFPGVLPFPGRASLTDVNNLVLNVTGTIIVPTTGTYTFAVRSDDGARIKIDGVTVFADDTFHGELEFYTAVNLSAGAHSLDFVFFEGGGGAQVELFVASGSHAGYNGAFSLLRSYPLGINENTASGSQVAALGASDDAGNTHTFDLVSGSGDTDNASFSLSTSGLLTTNFIPDFETKSTYSIRVRATDNTSQTYEQVLTVSIFDLNETPSAIALSNATVTEHNLVGSLVGTFSTTDQDATQNFTYSLVSGVGSTNNNFFAISGNTLLTQISTDYETLIPPTYSVRVRSTDQGGLFTEQDYVITILDANDPATDIVLSNAQIDENNAAGVTLGTLTTTDPNPGQTHTYSLVSGTGSTDNARFSITGDELKLLVSANYEVQPSYSIRIRTTDNGAPANLWYEEVFTITINGVNEAPGVTSALVYEITNPIRVGSNIAYNIDNSLIYGAVPFNRVRYRMEMFVGGVLRYADTSFEPWSGLTVAGLRVPDGAYPLVHKRTVSNMTVESNYPGVVNVTGATGALEHWPSSYSPGLNSLYDYDDDGFNSSLGYGSFQVHNMSSSPKQNVFAWNNHSSGSPDIGFGNQSSGHPDWTFAGSALGRVGWKMQVYIGAGISSYSISENNVADVSVGNVYAYDEDAGDGLTYQLVAGEGDTDNALFYLDGIALKTSISFDFETKSTYSVRIRATDLGGLSSEYVATISILNANETPTDIALSSATIAENNAANATVGTFTTTDVDTLDSFNYTLVAGAGSTDNGSFNISANALRLNAATNYELKSIYNVRIRSTDAGGLWVEKPFVVTITDANDTPHDITLTPASIAENQPVDSVVGALAALDQDPTHTHTFSLVGGTGSADNANFEVDGSNLKIKVSANFEAKNTYAIRVRTTDDGSPPAFYEEAMTVSITNVNETPTISDIANRTINEDTSTGSIAFTIGDVDAGTTFVLTGSSSNTTLIPNGNISFSGTGTSRFVLVSPAADLFGSADITVTVSDGTLSASDTFTLTVNSSNDAPSFTLSSIELTQIGATPTGGNGYSVGANGYGQLAAGSGITSTSTVVGMLNINDFTQVQAGDYGGIGLRADGTVWVWGRNEYGQLANGVTTDSNPSYLPIQVAGLTDVVEVDAGFGWFMARKSDGTVWTWGRNDLGMLGQGTLGSPSTTPVQVIGLSGVTDIVAGSWTAMALTSAGTVYTWGANMNGQLGRGTVNTHSGTATAIASLTGNVGKIFDTLGYAFFVEKTDGSVWAWGLGSSGNFGDGRSGGGVLSVVTPFQVTNLGTSQVRQLCAGYSFTLAAMMDGSVKVWGDNADGRLGLGYDTGGIHATPVTVPGLANINQVWCVHGSGYALRGDGRVFEWGHQNGFTLDNYNTPTLATGFTNIRQISAGQSFLLAVGNPPAPTIGLTVAEDSAAGSIPLLVDSFSPGPVDEAGQAVDFLVTNSNNALFSTQPAISPTGTLTYALATNANGSAVVSVRGHDNGGTANGGVDTSDPKSFTIVVTPVNDTPTALALSPASVAENSAINTTVGALSTTDIDAAESFTYSLVSGSGDEDNASFNISSNSLRTSEIFDFETKSSYNIRVRTTDSGGLFFENSFVVTVTNVNETPTDLALTSSSIAENNAVNATVGTLSTTDVDAGNTFTYSLVSGAGSTDNASFNISGSNILIGLSTNFEGKNSYAIRVRTTDQGGLFYEEAITISINDVNEAPTSVNQSTKSGALAWYKGDGNANDSTLNALHGTANGGVTFAAGFDGQAFNLDGGSSTSIVCGNGASFQLSNGTVEAWIKTPGAGGNYRGIIVKQGAYGLFLRDNLLVVYDWTAGERNTGVTLNDNQWHHVAFTFQAGVTNGSTIYIDGIARLTFTYNIYTQSYGLALGAGYGTGVGQNFSGLIDEATIYAAALTPTQVLASYNGGLALSIAENAPIGTSVGTFAGVDPDPADSLTYSLVTGTGDTDNASFTISGNQLLSAAVFDYETKNSYSARVRVTDSGGLFYEQALTVSVTNVNETPTALALTGSTVNENVALNTAVGTFSSTDVDAANTFTYTLVAGAGDTDNANFNISGSALRANAGIDFEAGASRSIRVRTTDQGGLFFESAFTITINDVNEMPSFALTTNDRVPFSTASAQSRSGFLININDGDSEATQTLTFNVTNNNNGMFSVQPAISSTGILTYTPNGTAGVATVSVSLTDDNSINSNAALTSAIQTFTITVDPSPDYHVVTTPTTLTITNLSNSSDTLSFTDGGTFATFAASGRTFSLNGALNQTGSISLPYASLPDIELITINAEGGNDSVNIGDFSALSGFPGLTINGGTGDDTVNLNGDISFVDGASLDLDLQNDHATPGIDTVNVAASANLSTAGSGTITVRTSRNLLLTSGASLQTAAGALIVETNQQATATTGSFHGVELTGGTLSSSSGPVQISAKAGSLSGHGLSVQGGGVVESVSGDITIVAATGSTAGIGSSRFGVECFGGHVRTTGGGHIHMTGSSFSAAPDAQGIRIGGGSGSGVRTSGATAGNITLVGYGSTASDSTIYNRGVNIAYGGTVTSTNGAITIYGTGGAGDSAGFGHQGGNGTLGGASTTGPISIYADKMVLRNGTEFIQIRSTGALTLAPLTPSASIGLGGASGTLNLVDDELTSLSDGFSSITIGDVTNGTGTISIDTATFTDPVLLAGGSIVDVGDVGTDLVVAGSTASFDGVVRPGNTTSSAVLSVTGNAEFTPGSTFSVEIGGLTPGTEHDQLSATGSVNIGAGTTLAYSKIGTYNPVIGQVLTIISRTGGTGTFAGAPEGTLLTLDFLGSGLPAVISYVGGDGDDVVIRVANPNIQVEQPVDTILADAVSTVDFGTRTIAMTSAQTFTVRNTGTSDLTLSSLDISGTHAADFAVTTAPGSMVIAPDATTTFVVTFTPSSNLTRTALLSISSNDPDEAVFTINLQGFGNFAPTDITISSATVPENSAAGISVGLLGAVDADVGQTHSFSLVSGVGSTDNAFFQIDGATLKILITTDFETKSAYSIRVRAEDAFSGSFEKQLIVTVLDMNDFPEITINNGAATAAYTVDEQTTFVTTVTAFDIDTPFQQLTYSVSGADAALFDIETQTGQLSFKAAPDYEAPLDANLDNVYQVNVIVTDDGSPNLSTSQALSVYVRDMNDLPVIVSHGGAESVPLTIPENTTAVTTVEAEDEDLPAQTLTYSIIGGADASRFAIDSETGVLTFINAPDADEPLDQLGDNTYYVMVCVTDDGAENLTDKQEIIVSVTNVNEAPTEITLSAASLDERNAVNAIVGSFSAEDQDLSQTHSFSLVTGTGSDDNSFFTITGAALSINVSTTYATKSSYSILVRATDSGSPELSFEKAFTITILPAGSAPLAVTDPATLITVTTATLKAKVTPNEIASTAWFVYGTDPTLTTDTVTTTAQSVGAGTVPVSTSAAITGLLPETVYYYRVLAENLKGTSEGIIRSFQTSYEIASNVIIPGAPSGNITLLRPLPGPINQAGQISFSATAKTGLNGITTAKDSILISDVSGGLRVIGQEGTAVPGGGTLFGSYTHQILTPAGQTVTLDRMSSSVTTKDYAYFVSPDGLSLELLSREGDAVTGGGTFMTHTGKPAADASERLYFQGTLTGVVATKNTGVWYDEAGDLLNLAKEGSNVTAITGDPAWLGNFQAMISAEGDGAAFIAALQNNPDSPTQKTATATNLGLFSGSPGSVGLVARKGQVIPSVGKLGTFSGLSRSNVGDHAFISLLTVSTTAPVVATTNDQVLMAEIGGNLHVVARENITPLVSTLKAARFGNFYITSEGEVIFLAWLAGAGVTTANDGVLCRWTVADGIELLAREGSLATGTGLNYGIFQVLSVSPGGAIALQSTLSSGIALMRALPGASLDKVVKNAENVILNGTSRSILTLSIHQTGAGTGGGGGGMGAAINDEGEVYTVHTVSGALYVGRVYP